MTTTIPTYTRRQRVQHVRLVGPRFEADWSEKATIIGEHPVSERNPAGGWYVVRFDDGGMLTLHTSHMRPSNEPPFKGRLPTYRQSQRP